MRDLSEKDKKFIASVEYRIKSAHDLAKRFEFQFLEEIDCGLKFLGAGFKSLVDGKCILIFNPHKRTVMTIFRHPRSGLSVRTRDIKTRRQLEKLFRYPRQHDINKYK